jgi:NAD(P)-dependent dehydrogenase (short-subunit alcohol dehydrogenase family)
MRTLVITGGTGGLGSAVVRRLAGDYRCIVLYRSHPPPTGIEGIAADLTDETSVKQAFAEAGAIYGLVHLAGGFAAGRVEETSLETWSKMVEVNLTAAFLAIREALPHLSRPGRIVAVSSIATLTRGAGSAAYTVSKSALNTLIEVVAKENPGIAANALLPGAMATPAMLRTTPAPDLVPLELVAETIAFLLSDQGASITGTLIPLRR